MCAWHKERFHTEFETLRSHFDEEASLFHGSKTNLCESLVTHDHLLLGETIYVSKKCPLQGITKNFPLKQLIKVDIHFSDL